MDLANVDGVGLVSDERRARAAAAKWPDGLIDRVVALRWPEWRVEQYLEFSSFPTPEMIEAEVRDRERLTTGLQCYEATWEDDERVADLFANSSERIGEWDVIVERSPHPYAQMRLQENCHMKVIAENGVAVACSAGGGRSSIVGGQKLSVQWMGGWRVRNGMRRLGYANMLMSTPASATTVFGLLTYWYVRMENSGALGFISHRVEAFAVTDEGDRVFDKLTATVHHYSATSDDTLDGAGTSLPLGCSVRLVQPADLEQCAKLINSTHAGQDLFRPYSAAWLEARLDDLYWGPKAHFFVPVYGWKDFYVLEHDEQVVACAGLWDRGRDVRERWRNRETGDERTVDSTYVLDTGFLTDRPEMLSALLTHLLVRSSLLGRTTMAVALEFLPRVRELMAWAKSEPETRFLETFGYSGPDYRVDTTIERPYTDLAYW